MASKRLILVNVAFVGDPQAGDRGWVLIDAGLPGTAGAITSAAAARFGAHARPGAIVMTHGHFDPLWRARNARRSVGMFRSMLTPDEHPYLAGKAAYPPPDPTVGGGLMSLLSPL